MYQEPPAQVPDGHPLQNDPPHELLSPQWGQPHTVAGAVEDVNPRPPAPTADMPTATRPMKLRRVMRLPKSLVVFSNSWSADMSVNLHWMVEGVFGRWGVGRRACNQIASSG
jgi:hypothetical protein